MKKFKKISFALAFALIITCFVPMLSGCEFSFGSKYKQFEINYTQNLEFFVGEDYYDANLKGIATKKDNTIVDVTDKMEVDASAYNKNKVGTYKIYCEFEDTKLSYEVKVVEEMTDEYSINLRLQKAINNTFKRNEDGVFSYEAFASNLFEAETGVYVWFNEFMIYEDNNGLINAYLKYDIEDVEDSSNVATAIEMWYQGTKTAGTITTATYGDEAGVEKVEDADLETFNTMIGFSSMMGLPCSIYAIAIDDIVADVEDCVLTKEEFGYYLECEDGFTAVWDNDIFFEVAEVSYDFTKSSISTIPTVPEATV